MQTVCQGGECGGEGEVRVVSREARGGGEGGLNSQGTSWGGPNRGEDMLVDWVSVSRRVLKELCRLGDRNRNLPFTTRVSFTG